MTNRAQIEKEILELPPADREQLALRMWESIIADESATADETLDPSGVDLAISRNQQIEAGKVSSISEEEFRDRTRGK
jgi:putative addiction module component (TIGR02574 family)